MLCLMRWCKKCWISMHLLFISVLSVHHTYCATSTHDPILHTQTHIHAHIWTLCVCKPFLIWCMCWILVTHIFLRSLCEYFYAAQKMRHYTSLLSFFSLAPHLLHIRVWFFLFLPLSLSHLSDTLCVRTPSM